MWDLSGAIARYLAWLLKEPEFKSKRNNFQRSCLVLVAKELTVIDGLCEIVL